MNLSSDDNSFFSLIFRRDGGSILAGGGRNMKWTGKNESFEVQHQKEHRFGWNVGSSKKRRNFEISLLAPCTSKPHPLSLQHSHAHTRLSVLNWGGFYLSHFKSGRKDEGLFTFQKRFAEKHIQPSTLLYQPVTILETASILCIALFESDIVKKADNITKWCLRVADGKTHSCNITSDFCSFLKQLTLKSTQLSSVKWVNTSPT